MKTFTVLLLLAAMGFVFLSCERDETPLTPSTVTDIDGNVYTTVAIGSQVWMAENLKVTHDPAGNVINDRYADPAHVATYGRLYNWETALKVCPKGWRLPTSDDWFTLLSHLDSSIKEPDTTGILGDHTAGMLKSTILWTQPTEGASNVTLFSALPSGFFQEGVLLGAGTSTGFWSATEGNEDQAFGGIGISSDLPSVFRGYMNKADGICVRCLKD